jgi:hypothetical protein
VAAAAAAAYSSFTIVGELFNRGHDDGDERGGCCVLNVVYRSSNMKKLIVSLRAIAGLQN